MNRDRGPETKQSLPDGNSLAAAPGRGAARRSRGPGRPLLEVGGSKLEIRENRARPLGKLTPAYAAMTRAQMAAPQLLQIQIQEPEGKLIINGQIFTPREMEILAHLCAGISSRASARELGISYRTVEAHRQSLREKSGAHAAVTLALWAVKHGLVKI